jgi:gluconolactonase
MTRRESIAGLIAALCLLVPAVGRCAGTAIFPEGASLVAVAHAHTHTEGPAQGPDGRIYFCDITVTRRSDMEAGAIYAFDPGTGNTTLVRSPSGMAAGLKFDAQGNMLATLGADFGSRSVVETDRATGTSRILAGLYQGRPFNSPNDLDIDDAGRIYFTDPRYFGHESIEQPTFGVYRIDPDRSVRLVAADLAMPNGIALSEDQQKLYVADDDVGSTDGSRLGIRTAFGRMQIVVYDIAGDGSLSNKRVFVDFGQEEGADGLAVDRRGNVYAAVRAEKRPGIRVYDPQGREIASMAMTNPPSNLALIEEPGGISMYVTAGSTLYRAPVLIAPRLRRRSWH